MPHACPCDWGSDCKKLEAILADGNDCRYAKGTNIIIVQYNPKSWKNIALRRKIEQYFHISDEIISKHIVYRIRKHHFHPALLDYLDCRDEFGKQRYLSTALPATIASNCGISGRINQYPENPDDSIDLSSTEWLKSKETTKFLAVPIYGKENYGHQVLNLGGLALVSSAYIPWARELLKKIRGFVNNDTVGKSSFSGRASSENG